MNSVIFIAGVHGVGKSYICNQVKQRYNINHYSASKLIEGEKKQDFGSNKKIDQINENQDYLLNALAKLPFSNKPILLDGHFCIVNKHSEIIVLPYNTISSISPIGIILIVNSPNKIYKRIVQRDGKSDFNLEFIQKLQDKELLSAQDFKSKYNVPYYEHHGDNSIDYLETFIESII